MIRSKKNKNKLNKKVEKGNKFPIFLMVIDILAIATFIIVYGDFKFFSDWLIPTSMTTMTHKFFARTLYNDEYISEVMNRNVTIEINEQTDASAIKISDNADTGVYDSIYDEQILKRNEGNDLYKVIDIEGSTWKGWIVAIYDPSRIELVLSSNLKVGAKTTTMAKEHNAAVAINGGGFKRGTNKVWPTGIHIQDGKILYDSGGTGKIIGFNEDNVLVLLDTTAQDAINQGVRYAVEFRPFLVVNGVASQFKGDGGYGKRPRTAIGQRQDGIVLMIVIDGKRMGTGISMPDLTDLFIKYKAYNAANLDGGGSSTLVINQKLHNDPAGWNYKGERWNVNAWIVK